MTNPGPGLHGDALDYTKGLTPVGNPQNDTYQHTANGYTRDDTTGFGRSQKDAGPTLALGDHTTTMASLMRMGTPETTPTSLMAAFGDPRTTQASPPRTGNHKMTQRERRRHNVGIARPHGNDGHLNANGDA